MRIILRCLFGAVLCAGVAVLLRAQDTDPERTKGTVLLLKNGHAMTGDIEKVGMQMRVRNGASEVWITNDRTARLCTDWDDAYRFMQTHVRADDANDHVKLARWCQLHRLNEQALDQAQKALMLKPAHVEARQLIKLLERAKEIPPEERPAAKPKSSKTTQPAPVSVDVVSETLIGFTTRVQPILMNACANCHASGQGGKFVLERVADSGSKPAAVRNLAAVLEYIDLDHPSISPLLRRSIEAHGGEQRAAFPGRDAKAFQAMQVWIVQTIERNPQLHAYRAVKSKPANPIKVETPTKAEPIRAEQPAKAPTPVPAEPAIKLQTQVTTVEPQKKTTPAVAPVAPTPRVVTEIDPFDPAPFNRHFHAQRLEQAVNAAK